ncbi:unnamed protein product, partial [Polarella glacialis]
VHPLASSMLLCPSVDGKPAVKLDGKPAVKVRRGGAEAQASVISTGAHKDFELSRGHGQRSGDGERSQGWHVIDCGGRSQGE